MTDRNPAPTPATVAVQLASTQLGARYARQVQDARFDRERRQRVRKSGYRGPLTRAELAAPAGR